MQAGLGSRETFERQSPALLDPKRICQGWPETRRGCSVMDGVAKSAVGNRGARPRGDLLSTVDNLLNRFRPSVGSEERNPGCCMRAHVGLETLTEGHLKAETGIPDPPRTTKVRVQIVMIVLQQSARAGGSKGKMLEAFHAFVVY
ncbi:hypothetical protein BaRGS_00038026 [Batillaria attramentaria]|uniref:Uncharacterized protein n=1 Tax=Batillaria attramentaria TaxID=370345 RepID=A0ABD0J776_9CAEN